MMNLKTCIYNTQYYYKRNFGISPVMVVTEYPYVMNYSTLMKTLLVKTSKEKELIDITKQVLEILQEEKVENGMCHLFLRHASAALTTTFFDVEKDLERISQWEVVLPLVKDAKHIHEHTHFMDTIPNYIMASFLGPSISIPIHKGKLMLGEYQRLVLVELGGPRTRTILIESVASQE